MGLMQHILCILKMFYENMYRMQSNTNWTIQEKFCPDPVHSGSGSAPLLYLKLNFPFLAAKIKFYQQRPWALKSINASDLSTAGACEIPWSGWGRLSAS
jgi:hypothetical protein